MAIRSISGLAGSAVAAVSAALFVLLAAHAATAADHAPAAPSKAALAEAPADGAAGHGAAHGAGHGGASLNPLAPEKIFDRMQRDLALFTAVVFLVLLALLWRFAWGPIAEGLQKREHRVRDEIASAEKANQDAKRLLDEYQQRLAASEAEVRGILEQGRRDADRAGREIIDKARAETEAEKQRALREIDTATAGALKELAERSASLAVDLAGKIVQGRLTPAEHARLVEEAVTRFPAKSNGGK